MTNWAFTHEYCSNKSAMTRKSHKRNATTVVGLSSGFLKLSGQAGTGLLCPTSFRESPHAESQGWSQFKGILLQKSPAGFQCCLCTTIPGNMIKLVLKKGTLTQVGKKNITQASGSACADTSQALEKAISCSDYCSDCCRWMGLWLLFGISAPSFCSSSSCAFSVTLWSKTQT